MANELAIVADNWMEFAATGNKLSVPFGQEIFLLKCRVAGVLHIDDVLIKTGEVMAGTPLRLQREPSNEHDTAAIAVYAPSGDKIGYVPKEHNLILSRLMDAGKLLVAKATYKYVKYYVLDLRMSISLKDI